MIIKYSEDIILSEWDDGLFGHYRRRDDISGTALVVISKFGDRRKGFYDIQFLYELFHLNDLYENRIVKDEPQNIKKSVDIFLIKMSKLKAFQ
jgi:hypothetical protein